MTDSRMPGSLREIGANIVMLRGVKTRRRIPRMYCGWCLNPVGPDARVIWDPTLEQSVIAAVMVCSQACEELAITSTEGVRRWSHMLLAEFLMSLQIGSGLLTRGELGEITREIVEELNIKPKGLNDAETE